MSEPRIFGPYTLLRRIAVGGMAEIHVAKTRGLGGFEKLVALKLVHPHLSADPHFVRMLIDEAKTVGMLAHVNIAQVFDLGCIAGTHFIAMEYVDGLDVHGLSGTATALAERLPVAVCCHIVAEMLNGLDYAHRKRDSSGRPLNLVHRDISPQNVMVSQAGEVKLVDFGIAKSSLQLEGTEVGVIKGKYYYMSPEQAWGDHTDRRSDVFSAGLLLHEMLTGQMVYRGTSIPQLIARVREAQIADPRSLRAEIPAPLAAVVMTALSRDARARFQSAIDMGEALRDVQYTFNPTFSTGRLGEFMLRMVEERARAAAREAEARAAAPEANGASVLVAFRDPGVTRRESMPERPRRPAPAPRSASRPPSRPPSRAPSRPPPVPHMTRRPPARAPQNGRSLPPGWLEREPANGFPDAADRSPLHSWPLPAAADNDEPTQQWFASPGGPRLPVPGWPRAASAFDESAPTARHQTLSPGAADRVRTAALGARAPGVGTPALVPPSSGDVPIETIPPTPPLPDFYAHSRRRSWLAWVVALACAGLGALAFHVFVTAPLGATLEIVTAPAGASVRIDDRAQPTRTPLKVRGLTPGRDYTVALNAPGHKAWTGTMRVSRGSVRQIVVLKPITGRVVIRSTPADAEVLLNGASMGRTPLALEDVSVSHALHLTLRRTGFREVRREVQLSDEAPETQLEVPLIPLTGSAP